MIRSFLLQSNNIKRDSFIWNMIGSFLIAFQSVIMLMFVTRTMDLRYSGIFTIAYTSANMFLTLGKYSMRNYQVSDTKNTFSFNEYRFSRYLSSIAMLVVSIVYILFSMKTNGYTLEKTAVIAVMCVYKVIDSIEDVYHANLQKNHRLDIAGKELSIRMISSLLMFGVLTIITKKLLLSLLISTVFSVFAFIYLNSICYSSFSIPIITNEEKKNGLIVLKTCFSLCVIGFLSYYIMNVAKYSIDTYLSDNVQAIYGFISMPVFVIRLMNDFIFTPLISKFSMLYADNNIKEFRKLVRREVLIIIGITFVCLVGAFILGVPVLSILYNTDLSLYKTDLLILLVAGGFLALSGFLSTILVIFREQNIMLAGYVLDAIIAFVLAPVMVRKLAIRGASLLYVLLMLILCVIFLIIYYVNLIKKSKEIKGEKKYEN